MLASQWESDAFQGWVVEKKVKRREMGKDIFFSYL